MFSQGSGFGSAPPIGLFGRVPQRSLAVSRCYGRAFSRRSTEFWFWFGLALHKVVNPLVMGVLFFVVITPIGLLMRLAGKRPLGLRIRTRYIELLGDAGPRASAGPHDQAVLTAMAFLRELTEFLLARKKYWLIPVVLLMVVFGGLVVLSQGSALAPFIYTIF